MANRTKNRHLWRRKAGRKKGTKSHGVKWIRCHACNELYTVESPCICVLDYRDEEE